MKIALQYLNDSTGKAQAVQMPLADWKKLVNRLRKYEQALKLKADLKEALEEVSLLKKSKASKQTLNEFLNEL